MTGRPNDLLEEIKQRLALVEMRLSSSSSTST